MTVSHLCSAVPGAVNVGSVRFAVKERCGGSQSAHLAPCGCREQYSCAFWKLVWKLVWLLFTSRTSEFYTLAHRSEVSSGFMWWWREDHCIGRRRTVRGVRESPQGQTPIQITLLLQQYALQCNFMISKHSIHSRVYGRKIGVMLHFLQRA